MESQFKAARQLSPASTLGAATLPKGTVLPSERSRRDTVSLALGTSASLNLGISARTAPLWQAFLGLSQRTSSERSVSMESKG